jgi:hypothetical protein
MKAVYDEEERKPNPLERIEACRPTCQPHAEGLDWMLRSVTPAKRQDATRPGAAWRIPLPEHLGKVMQSRIYGTQVGFTSWSRRYVR